DETLKGIADIIIAKQRNGPTGRISLAFLNKYARFSDREFHTAEE
ncbi:MAG TPA: DnaB-like helicase C-terminal domain-containing protein, partial [Acidobacteriota bacterium]|nr:DnaB-like helicase C-terminal domain-containing protein [Acidobacteriota bacterium]